MKTGEAYWNSRQQRAFDRLIAAPTQPGLAVARWFLTHSYEDPELAPVFHQKRVGREREGGRIFEIEKLRTLDGAKAPLSSLAQRFRKLGIDELAQLANVRLGEMSICGYRPLVPTPTQDMMSYEEVMDNLPPPLQTRWDYVTSRSNPGILSSFGLFNHTHRHHDANGYELRAEMDIRDATEASLVSNVKLLSDFAATAIARRLQ